MNSPHGPRFSPTRGEFRNTLAAMGETVVTGAAGHIGAVLVRLLLARGVRPRAVVHRDERALEGLDVERVRADVLDVSSLRAAFDGAEIVFHLAARISIEARDAALTEAVNVSGVENVVDACLAASVRRLVHFSSIHALSPEPRDGVVAEDRGLCDGMPVPHYDLSKAGGERALAAGLARGLDAVTVNPTGVIGPYDFAPSLMGETLLRLARRELPGLVTGSFDWVDVRDVCAGALTAAERGRSGHRYLLSGHRGSVVEIAALASAVTGVPAPGLVVPMWLARAGAPVATAWERARGRRALSTSAALHALRNHGDVSHGKATAELAYAPRPLATTIADTYRWFAERGLVQLPS